MTKSELKNSLETFAWLALITGVVLMSLGLTAFILELVTPDDMFDQSVSDIGVGLCQIGFIVSIIGTFIHQVMKRK